jgi:MFS family permease
LNAVESGAAGERVPRRPGNPLLDRSFLLFGTGQAISQTGSLMTQVALSLYVLKLTRSAALFANVLAFALIAQVCLLPFAGVAVDRFPRKRFMIFFEVVRGFLLVASFALFQATGFRMLHVYALVGCLAAGDAFFRPATNSIVPFLFRREHYVQGNAATAWLIQIVTVLSPPAAAFAFARFGLGPILLLDGLTFFASAVLLARVVFRAAELPTRAPSFWRDMREGMAVLLSSRDLFLPTCAIAVSRLFLDPFYRMGIPFILIRILSAPDYAVGISQSFMVIGGLASPALVYLLKRRYPELVALLLARAGKIVAFLLLLGVGFGSFQEVLRAHASYAVAHASLVYFLALFFNTAGYAFLSSHYQHTVPPQMLGRFAAMRFAVFAVAEPIGLKMYGFLLDHFPLVLPLLIALGGAVLELVFLLFVQESVPPPDES